MKAIQFLRDEHKRIRGLFSQIEALDSRLSAENKDTLNKDNLSKQLFMELEIHSALEEELFYPPLHSTVDDELKPLIDSSLEAHQNIADMIFELRELETNHPEYDERLMRLREEVELHMNEEESKLFRWCDTLQGPETGTLLKRIISRREKLESDPAYTNSLPEHVQDPSGGEQMRKGRVA